MRKITAMLESFIFIALAAFEASHDLTATWPGFAPAASWVAVVLVPLWIFAAIAVWSQKDWGFVGVIAGIVSVIAHGFIVTVGRSFFGPVFLVTGVILILLSKHAQKGALGWDELPVVDEDDQALVA